MFLGVRQPGEEETAPDLRQDPEDCVQLQARGTVQGGEEGVLLQGREEGLGEGLRSREEGNCR